MVSWELRDLILRTHLHLFLLPTVLGAGEIGHVLANSSTLLHLAGANNVLPTYTPGDRSVRIKVTEGGVGEE